MKWRVWKRQYGEVAHIVHDVEARTPEIAAAMVAARLPEVAEPHDELVVRDLVSGATHECWYEPQEGRAYLMRSRAGWRPCLARRSKRRFRLPAAPQGILSTIPTAAAPGLAFAKAMRFRTLITRNRRRP